MRSTCAAGRRRGGVAILVLALGLGMVPSADADPQTPPSTPDIQAARTAEELAAASVAQLEVELARLSAVADEALVAVQVAGEDYVVASERVATAATQAAEAQLRAANAQDELATARQALTAIALEAYRSGSSMSMLQAVVAADGYQDVVARTVAYQQFGEKAEATFQRFDASRIVAEALTGRAADAVAASKSAQQEADAALRTAEKAQQRADQLVADAETRRTTLIEVLAVRHHTTVTLERQRQDAVDAERRRRADAAAQAAHAAQQPAEPPAVPAPTSAPTAVASSTPTAVASPTPTAVASPPSTADPTPTPTGAATSSPIPTPAPTPPVTTSPNGLGTGISLGTAAQGRAAVAWAETKVGLPYRYGAAGPGSYDCSGLTSSAWNAQGIWITRSSRSQYQHVKKISYDDLRPGDLVFWGTSTTNPESVYHVAMWVGGGQIVEAPSPGLTLRVTAMRWSATMPYAGRA